MLNKSAASGERRQSALRGLSSTAKTRRGSPEDALEMITQQRAHDAYLARQPAPQTDEQIEFIRSWQPRAMD
jgi:hypothetical protein